VSLPRRFSVKKGQLVTTLTPKIGQASRTGRVVAVHEGLVEIEWEDGHRSLLTTESVVPLKRDQRAPKTSS